MLKCQAIKILEPLLFAGAILISAGLTYLLIKISHKCSLYDYPNGRKRHKDPTPFLGGIGIFVCFWILLITVSLICGQSFLDGQPYIPALFLSSLVIFLTGLIDDFHELKYYHKLISQIIAAVILIYFGFYIDKIYIPFVRSIQLGILSYPVTLLWVILIVNSINLIDGMDGLASTIGLSICLGLLIISIFLNITLITVISVILGGCLLGFLIYNKPPAKIFMGDSGSLFIGYIFAVAAIVCPIKSYTAVSMFVPLVAVSLPLLETVTTIIRRIVRKQRIYQPDNRHIFHYLQEFGFSDMKILVILGILSVIFNAFIPALFWFDRRQVFSIFVLFLVILVGIFFILKLKKGAGKV